MIRTSTLALVLVIACGGAPAPTATPPAAPPASATAASATPKPEEPPDPVYQEALRCLEDCLMTEDGEYDEVDARCRAQCDLEPVEP
ncbi:MAG: hypothetical protein JNK64_39420 [Myxococcales bacterium]|nr:hypothetical protein [Myxococcales bacterium]